jgi:hypothetical protein
MNMNRKGNLLTPTLSLGLTVQMSESLAQQLREYADKEGLTVDQLLASAAAE